MSAFEKQRSAGPHQLARKSLPEALAESLRERILNGEFKEGEPLIQETIGQEYDVSRMPVREALRQLEAQGLVVMKTHKGAVVTSIPAEQIAELFDLRAMLECDSLARAIPRMTEAHIAAAEAVLSRLEDAYHRGDIATWGRLNWEFHRSLYAAADRVQTNAILEGVNVQIDRYIRLQLVLTGAIEKAEQEHRELLRLCAAGDARHAVSFLRTHILQAGKALSRRATPPKA